MKSPNNTEPTWLSYPKDEVEGDEESARALSPTADGHGGRGSAGGVWVSL